MAGGSGEEDDRSSAYGEKTTGDEGCRDLPNGAQEGGVYCAETKSTRAYRRKSAAVLPATTPEGAPPAERSVQSADERKPGEIRATQQRCCGQSETQGQQPEF